MTPYLLVSINLIHMDILLYGGGVVTFMISSKLAHAEVNFRGYLISYEEGIGFS